MIVQSTNLLQESGSGKRNKVMKQVVHILVILGICAALLLLVYVAAQGCRMHHENELQKAHDLGYECGKANSQLIDITYWRASHQMEFLRGYNEAKEKHK